MLLATSSEQGTRYFYRDITSAQQPIEAIILQRAAQFATLADAIRNIGWDHACARQHVYGISNGTTTPDLKHH
jgi:hypothetical protein